MSALVFSAKQFGWSMLGIIAILLGILLLVNRSVSAYSSGSVLFSDGTSVTEDNSSFYWDDMSKSLGIGTQPAYSNHLIVGGSDFNPNIDTSIEVQDSTDNHLSGITVGRDSNHATELFYTNFGENTGVGSIDTANNVDDLYIDGANTYLQVVAGGVVGVGTTNAPAKLNVGGTIWGASTLYLGTPSTVIGCIAMEDSDGFGTTYVTANDGVLSASDTKPVDCE